VVVLAYLTFPEAMKKAHGELNKVVGSCGLPTFGDIVYLPYINALVTKCLRWRPLLPFGFGVVSENDEYVGYRIPKGAIVMPNHWAQDLDEPALGNATDSVRSVGWRIRICPWLPSDSAVEDVLVGMLLVAL